MALQLVNSLKQSTLLTLLCAAFIALTACGGGGGGGGGSSANVDINFPTADATLNETSSDFSIAAKNADSTNIANAVITLNGTNVSDLFTASNGATTASVASMLPFVVDGNNRITARVGDVDNTVIDFTFQVTPRVVLTNFNNETLSGLVRQAVLESVLFTNIPGSSDLPLTVSNKSFSGTVPGTSTFAVTANAANGRSSSATLLKTGEELETMIALQLNNAGFVEFGNIIAEIVDGVANDINPRAIIPVPTSISPLLCAVLVGNPANAGNGLPPFTSIFTEAPGANAPIDNNCVFILQELDFGDVNVTLEVDDTKDDSEGSYSVIARIDITDITALAAISAYRTNPIGLATESETGDTVVTSEYGRLQLDTEFSSLRISMEVDVVKKTDFILALELPAIDEGDDADSTSDDSSTAITVTYGNPKINGYYCSFLVPKCGSNGNAPGPLNGEPGAILLGSGDGNGDNDSVALLEAGLTTVLGDEQALSPATVALGIDEVLRPSFFVNGDTEANPSIAIPTGTTTTSIEVPGKDEPTQIDLTLSDSVLVASLTGSQAHGSYIGISGHNSAQQDTVNTRAPGSYFDPENASEIAARDLGSDEHVVIGVSENFMNQWVLGIYQTGLIGAETVSVTVSELGTLGTELIAASTIAGQPIISSTDIIEIDLIWGGIPYFDLNAADNTIEMVLNNVTLTITDISVDLAQFNELIPGLTGMPVVSLVTDIRAKIGVGVNSLTKRLEITVNTDSVNVFVDSFAVTPASLGDFFNLDEGDLQVLIPTLIAPALQEQINDSTGTDDLPIVLPIDVGTLFSDGNPRHLDLILQSLDVDDQGEFLFLKTNVEKGPNANALIRVTLEDTPDPAPAEQ